MGREAWATERQLDAGSAWPVPSRCRRPQRHEPASRLRSRSSVAGPSRGEPIYLSSLWPAPAHPNEFQEIQWEPQTKYQGPIGGCHPEMWVELRWVSCMRGRPMRLLKLIALILTFGLGPLASTDGGWACPDGTPCVGSASAQFRCARECAVASCCDAGHCHHGALPGMADPLPPTPGIERAGHCRFDAGSAAHAPTARLATTGIGLEPAADAALESGSAGLPLLTGSRLPSVADTGDDCPPLLLPTGPARAPPAL